MFSAPTSSIPFALTLSNVQPITRLLEKRSQLLSVHSSLDAAKVEFNAKEAMFRRREENLRKKDLELQQALVLFDRFLRENEMKRRRADARANEEIKRRLHWEKEIVGRASVLNQVKNQCEKTKRLVQRNEKYAAYLQRVFDDHSQPFDEVHSIIARHSTLAATNDDLMQAQHEIMELNETERNATLHRRKDQYNQLLHLTNEVARQSALLEDAELKRRDIEESMRMFEEHQSTRDREIIQIVLAADNLYQRCKQQLQGIRRHGGDPLAAVAQPGMSDCELLEAETDVKLTAIGDYITDVEDLLQSVSGQVLDAHRSKQQEQVL